MPRRRVARLRPATVIVLVVLSVAVAVAGTLLAVPGWRAAVLPATNVTTSAAPPVGWRAPETAPPAPLPLDELATSPAPAARALLAAMPKLAKDAAATPGVVVVDPSTGKTLIGRGDKPVLPASTMKVLTGLVALDTLPAEATFRTAVVSPRRGVLVLRGGGDPLLSDARASGRASLQQLAEATAKELKAAGIRKVSLGYDATLFTGRGWHAHWTDNYRYSVAPISALMIGGGRSPRDGRAQKNPAASAAGAFAARLAKAGITVGTPKPAKASDGATELAAVASPSVQQLVEHTLRYSDNVAAETLARHVGLATRQRGDFAGAYAAVRDRLRALGLWATGMVIDDSSGLSRDNRVTPGVLAAAMRLVLSQDRLRPLIAGLPVGGVTGTLADRFTDRASWAGRGIVRAKTGSLRDVSTLAGYLVTAQGAPLVFALTANQVRLPNRTRQWMDRTTAAWAACGCP